MILIRWGPIQLMFTEPICPHAFQGPLTITWIKIYGTESWLICVLIISVMVHSASIKVELIALRPI